MNCEDHAGLLVTSLEYSGAQTLELFEEMILLEAKDVVENMFDGETAVLLGSWRFAMNLGFE